MELLSPAMDVVAYDRRGFGETLYEPEQHDQVVDLLAVVDALAADTPAVDNSAADTPADDNSAAVAVVLVGNSMGGRIALDFTLAHPARVAALVLIAPAVSGAPVAGDDDVDATEAAIWETLEAADAAGALDALNLGEIRFWVDGPHAPEGRVDGPLRQLALEMNRIALHAESPGHEPEPPEAWTRLSEVQCPVLVVVGDLDMGHLQQRCREIATRIAGARLHVMEGTAHLPAFEQPAVFTDVLRGFLAHIPD